MSTNYFRSERRKLWPWLVIAAVLALAIYLLRRQGRLWVCSCGQIYVWVSNIWSSDNSQHLFDPYSFTHLLHGVVFFWVLVWALPQLSLTWRLCIAIAVEALWEVVENSQLIIDRYREATASLDYAGDAIINSIGDILIMSAGFMLAYWLGFRRSLILFVAVEIGLIFWIRDSLSLSIIMLIYPVEAIKAWQLANAPL
jgi:hypothetical protein